jgi:hypothetical protein
VPIPIRVAGAVPLLLLFFSAGGCSDPGRSNQAEESSSLKPLAAFYGKFVNQHGGKPPGNEAELKAFLKEPKNAESLRLEFKVADVDAMFISPRDNQPYVVIYGTLSGPPGPGGAPVIAHEKTGVEGKRFVASALGAVEEVDEARFRGMVP